MPEMISICSVQRLEHTHFEWYNIAELLLRPFAHVCTAYRSPFLDKIDKSDHRVTQIYWSAPNCECLIMDCEEKCLFRPFVLKDSRHDHAKILGRRLHHGVTSLLLRLNISRIFSTPRSADLNIALHSSSRHRSSCLLFQLPKSETLTLNWNLWRWKKWLGSYVSVAFPMREVLIQAFYNFWLEQRWGTKLIAISMLQSLG